MEAVLRRDPAGVYERMTFATRDQYRHVVERIAKRCAKDEPSVAQVADRPRAGRARPTARGRRTGARHVGYYLVDDGLTELERLCEFRPPAGLRLYRWALRHPNVVFVGGVLAGTVAAILARALARGAGRAGGLAGRAPVRAHPGERHRRERDEPADHGLPAAPPSAQARSRAARRGPRRSSGRRSWSRRCSAASRPCARRSRTSRCSTWPTAKRTCSSRCSATSPTRPPRRATATRRSSRPRWRACARSTRGTPRRRRRVLPLPPAAALESEPGRVDGLGAEARQARRVQPLPPRRRRGRVLEHRRRPGAAPRSALRHHPRRRHACCRRTPRRSWSARWPIRSTAPCTTPSAAAWCAATASSSRGSASRCRARTARSFAAVHSGHPGVDPYTTAVSDVYQDLYGEGSFTGKGIYDVDAFERATHGRFPENTLLSHDLIEGNYARAGLATDIVVYDDYPAALPHLHPPQAPLDPRRLAAAAAGSTDRVPGPDGPEPQPAVAALALEDPRQPAAQHWSSWRSSRSWSPAGRSCPGDPLRWTLLGLGAIAAPPWSRCCSRCSGRRWTSRGAPTTRRWRTTRPPASSSWRWPSSSCPTRPGSRPTRSCARCGGCCVSRRQLLEWQTASQTERLVRLGAGAAWRTMWPAVALAARASWSRPPRCRGARRPRALDLSPLIGAAAPLVAAVDRSRPSIAYAISAPAVRRERRLPALEPRRRRCATRCSTGATSTGSSPRRPTGSRRTTSRRIRSRWWRCAPRPPTSACSSSRR